MLLNADLQLAAAAASLSSYSIVISAMPRNVSQARDRIRRIQTSLRFQKEIMPISQSDMKLERQLKEFQELESQGYLKKECAEKMGCSPAHITFLSHWLRAVFNEEVAPELERVLMIHNSTGSIGRPLGWYFSFHDVCELLGLRLDRDEETWDDIVATKYGPYAQRVALEKALGKPLEDASDDDLRHVCYSDFKRHLKKP
ncbi:MAG: hypothetical protein OXB98_05435 [Bryobacterales bacterium]|nr:hypothetical protein [Bryobacterales bacterium]